MIYPDGTCPPWYIVERFFEVCERVAMDQGGVVAVHCMAGLGRTGTLIGAYLMRHFDMTARETIAFLRLMRPGSVVGPQQNWLAENEWRIRKRDYQYPQSNGQSMQSLQEERQKEIQERLLKMQQSHRLTLESAKSSTTVTPAGSAIHTPGTKYEQVFSRANSEGLESTWSEIADEVEGESLTLLDDDEDDEDEAETSGFEDMTTSEEESMEESNMAEDTDEDKEGDEYGIDWDRSSRLSSPQRPSQLKAQHSRRISIGSVESLTSAFERDSVTDDKEEPVDGDIDMVEARATAATVAMTPSEEPLSLMKEHIGSTDYVIPGQPRKQDLAFLRRHHQHHQRQASGSSANSHELSDATLRTHHDHHDHDRHQFLISEQQKGPNHHDDKIRFTGEERKLYDKESFLNFSDSSSSSPAAASSIITLTPLNSSASASASTTASASQGISIGRDGGDDLGHYRQGPSEDVERTIRESDLAHILRTGGMTSTGSQETMDTTKATTTKTPITTREGNAQGTSYHDLATYSHSSAVGGTNDDTRGLSEFEFVKNSSQPPPSVLVHTLPPVVSFTDKDKTEGVNNHHSHPQQHHNLVGQEHRQSSSPYQHQDKQDAINEEEKEEKEENRRLAMTQSLHPLQKQLFKGDHQHHNRSHHHHHHIHHKQNHQQEVPDSPPSLNTSGGSGGGGSAEQEEVVAEGSGGERSELSQETRAGSVEMCR